MVPPSFQNTESASARQYVRRLPSGHLECVLGPSGAGKSFYAMTRIREAVAQGRGVTLFDVSNEHAEQMCQLEGTVVKAGDIRESLDLSVPPGKPLLVLFEDVLSNTGKASDEKQLAQWSRLEPLLLARMVRGDLLVLNDTEYLQHSIVAPTALQTFLGKLLLRGVEVVLTMQAEASYAELCS